MKAINGFVLILFAAGMVWGQEAETRQPAFSLNHGAASVKLQIRVLADPAISLPEVFLGEAACASDGTMLMRFMEAEGDIYSDHSTALSISPDGKITKYPYEQINNLVHARILHMDMVEDRVVFQLNAAGLDESDVENLRLGPAPAATGQSQAQWGDYVAIFKSDGSYEKSFRLNLAFRPTNIIALEDNNDDLLALGVNFSTERPVLAILDDGGGLRRYLDADMYFPSNQSILDAMPKSASGIYPSGAGASQKLSTELSSFFQFAHHGVNVDLLAPGSDARILEIDPGGAIRSVRLKLPKGVSAYAIVPTSGRNWIVRSRSEDQKKQNGETLLEFDPDDGALVRQITTGDVPETAIMCGDKRSLYGLHWSGGQAHILVGVP